MKTYHHIVVGVDFSPASKAALLTTLRLASFGATPVTVVHVIDPTVAASIKEAHHFSDEELLKHVNELVQTFLKESQPDGSVPLVNVAVEMGHPFELISAACQKHAADLLVLGTHGSRQDPTHIGAVAAKCARKVLADVLLVREESTGPFQHVTACVDFSETAANAVSVARFMAEHDQAALDTLFVHQSTLAMSLDYGGFLPPLSDLEVTTQAALKEEMDEFLKPLLQSANIKAFRSVVLDRVNIRDAIIEHIKESNSDLVVLGTRGKTDLRTLFFGTTAEKVVTHAPCSVLAVKPEALVHEEAEARAEEAMEPQPLMPVG